MAGFLKKIFSFGRSEKNEPEQPVKVNEIADHARAETGPVVENESATKPRSAPKQISEKTKPVAKTKQGQKKSGAKNKPTKPATTKPLKKNSKPSQLKKKEAPTPASPPKPKKPPTAIEISKPSNPTPVSTRRGVISLGETETVDETQTKEFADEKTGWFSRLRKGLARSSTQLTENVTSIFTKRKLDEDTLMELEDVLIQADLGVDTAIRITEALSEQRHGKDVSNEEIRDIMATEIEKSLSPVARPLELNLDHKPHVILVVGVNGSGKTTTIGKLTAKLANAGLSTMLVAGDTFRAAAIEQLKVWGERTGAPVVSRELGSDAAGLAYEAYEQAKSGGHDVMLMDTAGRLQNKTELMQELEKIIRVIKKHDETAPHTVLLTLDATTGQNALSQVEIFGKVAGVNGLVMTKLDGTARGGILVAISAKYKLPVYFIGVGEQVEDLEPFEARDFARSIAGYEA